MGPLAAVGMDHLVTTNQADELPPEGVANKAVDDEVDPGVDDGGEVSNMGEAANQHDRLEEGSGIPAVKNNVDVEELIDINDDSRAVEDEKGDNNAEKNKEEVDLSLHFLLRSKPLNFYISEITNNSDIEKEHGKEGHDGREGDVEVGLVHLDITLRSPELSRFVVRDSILPDQDCIKESRDVGDDADERDRENVEPGLPCVGRELEWVADAQEPLNGYGKGREDASAHPNIAEGMDEERKEDGINAASGIKCSACIVDPATYYEDGVIAGESKEELVETVFELGTHEDNEGEDVTDDANEAKDRNKNPVKVISIVENYSLGDISWV